MRGHLIRWDTGICPFQDERYLPLTRDNKFDAPPDPRGNIWQTYLILFSSDFSEARTKFVAAAQAAGATIRFS